MLAVDDDAVAQRALGALRLGLAEGRAPDRAHPGSSGAPVSWSRSCSRRASNAPGSSMADGSIARYAWPLSDGRIGREEPDVMFWLELRRRSEYAW